MDSEPFFSEDLQGWTSECSVSEATEKGKQPLAEIRSERTYFKMAPVSKAAIRSVQSKSDILHASTKPKGNLCFNLKSDRSFGKYKK